MLNPAISSPSDDWFCRVQLRMAELGKRFPLPAGVSVPFWSMLGMMASQQDSSLALLCLEHGKVWSGVDRAPVRAGPAKRCFESATLLALGDTSLTYVEGYGCTRQIGIAIHHAWVVDPQGRVLDPTWKEGVAYCGLPFKQAALRELTCDSRQWGVFGGRLPKWVLEDISRWRAEVIGHSPGSGL